jgi:AhpD family alkylhydroperoxidase
MPAKALSKYPFLCGPSSGTNGASTAQMQQAVLLRADHRSCFMTLAALYGVVDRCSSPIDLEWRSLVTVHVLEINDCPFCVDINSATLLKRDVSVDKVEALPLWHQNNQSTRRLRMRA